MFAMRSPLRTSILTLRLRRRTFAIDPTAEIADIEERIRLAEAASKRGDWTEAIKYWEAVVHHHGDNAPKKFRSSLWRARQERNSEQALRQNPLIYKALADVDKVIWLDPSTLQRKVLAGVDIELYRGAVLGGDWDRDVISIIDTIKYQSLVGHFLHGVAWEETGLFKDIYQARLARGEHVRGCKTIEELARAYAETVDTLFDDIKLRGFVLPQDATQKAGYIPHVHIARDGEVLYGRAGNHRLTIAKILKVKRFPCVVRARHVQWQALREELLGRTRESAIALVDRGLADHPDLADVATETVGTLNNRTVHRGDV